jgi:hypothetical protein
MIFKIIFALNVALFQSTTAWKPSVGRTSISPRFSTLSHYMRMQASDAGSRSDTQTPKVRGKYRHNEGFRFMSTIKGSEEYYYPRIVPVAGVYPECTAADVAAPYSLPPCQAGTWMYDFSDAQGPQLGTFAAPGCFTVHDCEDPVALISSNTAVNIVVGNEDSKEEIDVEVVLIVDRGDLLFKEEGFYLFETASGKLDIFSCDRFPEGHKVLGRVMLTCLPWDDRMVRKSTGWLEDE